jgi:peptidoglycan L-alanyl-D-glutamate endopeptidase CwlK
MSRYILGPRSLRNLEGVHPDLVRAVELAIKYTTQDFTIIDGGGLRTPAQALANAAAGTGIAKSQHLPQSDGYGHAVDLVAWVDGKPDWGRHYYDAIRRAMLRACDEIGLPIQHGADWDMDGVTGERGEWDWPHFQMPAYPHKLEVAKIAMMKRLEARA